MGRSAKLGSFSKADLAGPCRERTCPTSDRGGYRTSLDGLQVASCQVSEMTPLFIAKELFGRANRESWNGYVEWSGLRHLDEVVALDSMLCPSVLPNMEDRYWPHVVNEDYLLSYFIDLDFLESEVAGIPDRQLLCVVREPGSTPVLDRSLAEFQFCGFDLVELESQTSALTNCGGFEGAFEPDDLSSKGLILDHDRAIEVQRDLRRLFPDELHANCDVWAIFRQRVHVVCNAPFSSRLGRSGSAAGVDRFFGHQSLT